MPFRAVRGHRHILELLASAVGRGAVPQSLLFEGPEGVGKRRTAIALAQAINCTQIRNPSGTGDKRRGRSESDPCDCSACRRIARGVHPDVVVLEPGESGSIKIEDVREAIGRAAFRPFEGRRRVTIVDDADALVLNAQDALLKTLEEPASGSMFVLVTARPDALLPTIRSRCYRLRFGRLAEADVVAILRTQHDWTEADARAAAALADGSVGAALDARTDEAAEARQAALGLLRGVAEARNAAGRLDEARELSGGVEREELARRLRAAASMLRDVQILASGGDERLLANADLRDALESLGKRYNTDRGLAAFAAIDAALAALDRNVGPKVVADWVAMEL